MEAQLRCCIEGCRAGVGTPSATAGEYLCRDHLALASPAARSRMLRAQIRLIHLEARLHDDAFFQALVAGGRYLKFCAVVDHASEVCGAAWTRAQREIRAELARRAGAAGRELDAATAA